MKYSLYCIVLFLISSIFWCCEKKQKQAIPLSLQLQYEQYLEIGDSIYSTKEGYNTLATSMMYFDSAMMIANSTRDTLMLAESVFAKARVYDAWNKEPQKTVDFFKEAAQLYQASGESKIREYYIKHLIAHAYGKMKDSVRCENTLLSIYDTIAKQPIEMRKKMEYIPQMAFISTEIKNYDLAEKILSNLYQTEWIKNNPKTINFKNFYFLTKSRIDVFKYKRNDSPFLDSFNLALHHISTPMDSIWYYDELSMLSAHAQKYQKGFAFLQQKQKLQDKMNDAEGLGNAQNQMLNLELQAERKKVEAENEKRNARNLILGLMFLAITIISFLSFRMRQSSEKYKLLSEQLTKVNAQKEAQVSEVELINKEIQHRIKNNLHLIFSLLNMQERRSENPDTIENLQKARLRIESIAGLHDQLNRTNNQDVNFNAYINHLIQTIIDCMETEHKIFTNLEIDPITVPHQYYFSIGLILNEWITNSIKYADTPSLLMLNIKMRQLEHGVEIEYFDNGKVTNNENIKIGLGKEIITLLTKQMKGKVTTLEKNPFHYFLTFKNGQ
jgi:two-component sensor histidine kinase